MVHFKMACYMLIGLIMLAAGCAPSAAKKTDTDASASAGSTPKHRRVLRRAKGNVTPRANPRPIAPV